MYLLSDPEQTNGPPLSPKQASLPPSFKPAQSIPDVILYNGRNKVFLRHSSVEITGSCTSCRVSAAQRKHIFLYFWYIVIDQCIFTWLVFFFCFYEYLTNNHNLRNILPISNNCPHPVTVHVVPLFGSDSGRHTGRT